MFEFKRLALAVGVSLAIPVAAQDLPPAQADGVAPDPATKEQQALINDCSGHKFETVVVVDPVKNRGSRIKLCSNPGATDADWVRTLKDAIEQAGKQTSLPLDAREELIAQLKDEVRKYEKSAEVKSPPIALIDPSRQFASAGPDERFETSTLPPLEPLKRATSPAGIAAGGAASAGSASSVNTVPSKPMRIAVKCLRPGDRGDGATCDFFEKDTVLSIRAIVGLEEGGVLRFRRRGDEKARVDLANLSPGQSTRVRLPGELCRGVKTSKVEIELLSPTSTGSVAHRLGPYGMRC